MPTLSPKTAVLLRGLAGAAIGGAAGFFGFAWLLSQGYYALVLPGALMGMVCGWLSRGKSLPLGIACAVATVFLSLLAEWKFRPFAADQSLAYFVSHLHFLKPTTWLMLVVGAAMAYWFGVGRERMGVERDP